jgi:hypothetical protein
MTSENGDDIWQMALDISNYPRGSRIKGRHRGKEDKFRPPFYNLFCHIFLFTVKKANLLTMLQQLAADKQKPIAFFIPKRDKRNFHSLAFLYRFFAFRLLGQNQFRLKTLILPKFGFLINPAENLNLVGKLLPRIYQMAAI